MQREATSDITAQPSAALYRTGNGGLPIGDTGGGRSAGDVGYSAAAVPGTVGYGMAVAAESVAAATPLGMVARALGYSRTGDTAPTPTPSRQSALEAVGSFFGLDMSGFRGVGNAAGRAKGKGRASAETAGRGENAAPGGNNSGGGSGLGSDGRGADGRGPGHI